MAGKTRPSLMAKTLTNVALSNLSLTDKKCIEEVFKKFEVLTSADVVEVVRCSECKRYSTEFQMCLRSSGLTNAKPNDFCSYGERRTGNDL